MPDLVKQVHAEEMLYFCFLSVHRAVPRHTSETGSKVIGTRWVDVSKGDTTGSSRRSKIVGRKFNIGKDETLYAAPPPLQALRVILNTAATRRADGSHRSMMMNDVRQVCFHAKATRDLCIELPADDPEVGTGVLGKLQQCFYGT